MKEKTTGELQQELMEKTDIKSYLRDNQLYFTGKGFLELLNQLHKRYGLSKAELARRASMSEVYLHQVFSGRRNPSRDRLLCICIGSETTLDEVQTLLRRATYAQLYPKNKRDSIIIHGILHHISLNEINEKLLAENEKTLL